MGRHNTRPGWISRAASLWWHSWNPRRSRPAAAAQTYTVFPLQTPAGRTAPLQIETLDSFRRMLIEHKSQVHSEIGNSRHHSGISLVTKINMVISIFFSLTQRNVKTYFTLKLHLMPPSWLKEKNATRTKFYADGQHIVTRWTLPQTCHIPKKHHWSVETIQYLKFTRHMLCFYKLSVLYTVCKLRITASHIEKALKTEWEKLWHTIFKVWIHHGSTLKYFKS